MRPLPLPTSGSLRRHRGLRTGTGCGTSPNSFSNDAPPSHARADRLDLPALHLAHCRPAARPESRRSRLRGLWRHDEPHHVARIAYNLANQFELPVIFYAAVVLLIATNEVTTIDLIAAWFFVAGRVIHTLVQCLTDNVPLRGQVFLINFAGVALLVGHVTLLAFEGLGR
ncbi:MAG: MAPEG family protein [Xanthobacteraceae bacterium]